MKFQIRVHVTPLTGLGIMAAETPPQVDFLSNFCKGQLIKPLMYLKIKGVAPKSNRIKV